MTDTCDDCGEERDRLWVKADDHGVVQRDENGDEQWLCYDCISPATQYLCELCSYPTGAHYHVKKSGGMKVCGTHATALEDGSWDGEMYDVRPIEGDLHYAVGNAWEWAGVASYTAEYDNDGDVDILEVTLVRASGAYYTTLQLESEKRVDPVYVGDDPEAFERAGVIALHETEQTDDGYELKGFDYLAVVHVELPTGYWTLTELVQDVDVTLDDPKVFGDQ